jgi:hypothetical protein
MPRATTEDAIFRAKGNVRKLEEFLGLDNGYLGSTPLLVEIPHPVGYRIPPGNEFGANTFWGPGGFTGPGGLPEAVIDPVTIIQFTNARKFSTPYIILLPTGVGSLGKLSALKHNFLDIWNLTRMQIQVIAIDKIDQAINETQNRMVVDKGPLFPAFILELKRYRSLVESQWPLRATEKSSVDIG